MVPFPLVGLLTTVALSASGCNPVPGASALWADPATRFVVVGELHGTAESPAVFVDLICEARAAGRPIAVALEHPTDVQGAIDTWLASDGSVAAKAALLEHNPWNYPDQDGRGSVAFLELLDRLRNLREKGEIVGVSTFLPTKAFSTPGLREQAMAEAIVANSPPAALTLVLVGNAHARRLPISRPGAEPYQPMAALFPTGTVTVNVVPDGGAMWGCFDTLGMTPAAIICESRNLRPARAASPFGVALTPDVDEPYSAVLHLGRPSTASPPAVAPLANP